MGCLALLLSTAELGFLVVEGDGQRRRVGFGGKSKIFIDLKMNVVTFSLRAHSYSIWAYLKSEMIM